MLSYVQFNNITIYIGLHTKGEFISYELGQWNFQFLNGSSPNGCQESNSTQFVIM